MGPAVESSPKSGMKAAIWSVEFLSKTDVYRKSKIEKSGGSEQPFSGLRQVFLLCHHDLTRGRGGS
jgi:hypothetical protein